MNINENNIIAAATPLAEGQRVIQVGNRYFPVGIGGNYIPSGTTGTLDLPTVTVTSDKMLEGVTAIVKGEDGSPEVVTGTIETVTAEVVDDQVVVPAGYIAREQTFPISMDSDMEEVYMYREGQTVYIDAGISVGGELYIDDAEIEVNGRTVSVITEGFVNEEMSWDVELAEIDETETSVTIYPGYVDEELHYTIGGSESVGGSSNVQYGYIDDNGKFQELDLSGSSPAATGSAVNCALKMFKTGQSEPGYTAGGSGSGSAGGGTGGGTGGSIDLYKCVSVDDAAQTWSGRKAVLTDSGEYVISDAVTDGLSYAGGLNVKKGKIYTADGKIRSSKVYNHCLCIFSFNGTYEDMRGNCKIPMLNNGYQPSNQVSCDGRHIHWGAQSLIFNHASTSLDELGLPVECYVAIDGLTSLNAFTVDFWEYKADNIQRPNDAGCLYLANEATKVMFYGATDRLLPQNEWFHHAFVRNRDASVICEYVNGSKISEFAFPEGLLTSGSRYRLYMGVNYSASVQRWIDSLSIWDIAKYSGNFTPPTEPYKIVWEDAPTITLSGAGLEDVNGTYELITPDAAGKSRVWAKPMSPYIIKYDDDWWSWIIKNGESNCYSGSESDDPWKDEWYDATDDESGGDAPTFTVNE